MNLELLPYCPAAGLAVLIWIFVVAAKTTKKKSSAYASAAAAVGIGGLIPALTTPAIVSPKWRLAIAILGGLAFLLGTAAVVLAVRAYFARRSDRGPIVFGVIVALLGGIVSGVFGFIFMVKLGEFVPAAANPWIWRSNEHGFEVTVPSEKWTQQINPNVPALFACSQPNLTAMVAEVVPAPTDAEFEAAQAFGRKIRDDASAKKAIERSGTNAYGHPYWLFVGEAGGQSPYVLGVSVTRIEREAVLMIFEGHYTLATDAARAQESEALRTQADQFLGSVK